MKNRFSFLQRVTLALWLAMVASVTGQTAADQSPYVALEGREIKALSPEQIEGYEAGLGMGLAMAAEMNGYPGPRHVLELRDELDLTEAQIQSTERVFGAMQEAARGLGRQIVTQERELDRLFAAHDMDTSRLSERVMQVAELQGQLRAAHLLAHLEMMQVLSHEQIERYIELRGYRAAGHQAHHPEGGHSGDD
ncbi:MAG: Spy/CpxP family protein refolding chaperone [Thermoanaerobaculia bacterium]